MAAGECSEVARIVSDSDDVQEELIVECNGLKGSLIVGKCKDGRSKCVKVGGEWLTPCEFERKAGRSSAKDWKKSIRYNERPVKEELERRAGVNIKGKRDEGTMLKAREGSVQNSEGGANVADCVR